MARKRSQKTDIAATLFREFALALGKSAPDEDKLVESAVEACINLLQACQCSVWLHDKAANCLRIKSALGYKHYKQLNQDKIKEMVYPLDRPESQLGITGWIFCKQTPVVADSYDELRQKAGYQGRHDPQLHNIPESDREEIRPDQHPCQQFYGAPITLGEEQFGVLKVENKRLPDDSGIKRFSEADQAALDTVAAMLALALRYARASRQAQERLISYYRFTVHAIRNEIYPIEGIKTILSKFPMDNLDDDQRARLNHITELSHVGTDGVHFYLNNLLKFLEERLDLQPVDITEVLEDEIEVLTGASKDYRIEKDIPDSLGIEARLIGDRVFLSAVIKEILRNARQAIKRRYDKEEVHGIKSAEGVIKISARTESYNGKSFIRISIADNGNATVGKNDQEQLRDLFEQSKNFSADVSVTGTHGRLGLLFINEVISRHGGHVRLNTGHEFTTFDIFLPTGY